MLILRVAKNKCKQLKTVNVKFRIFICLVRHCEMLSSMLKEHQAKHLIRKEVQGKEETGALSAKFTRG